MGLSVRGHMAFQGSVVFVASRHCLACPTWVFGLLQVSSSTLVRLFLYMYLGSISCQLCICFFLSCDFFICGVDVIKVRLHGQLGMTPSCV